MESNIKIVTKQYDENNNVDTIEIEENAKVYDKNGYTYVVYKEVENGNSVTNTIKISQDEVSIKKFGSINSTMIFKKGYTDYIDYKTAYGLFKMNVYTTELSINKINKIYIDICIKYDMEIQNLFKGKNEISISIECFSNK